MVRILTKSILLLFYAVVLCCGIYPLALFIIGQVFFPFQANGSLLQNSNGKWVGSKLIAQSFTKDEYFWPRPSAASYDASASASSALAASNFALRDRVSRTIGPIVKYRRGPKAHQLVAPDIESWFQQDSYQGKPHIVAQWAMQNKDLARYWIKSDPIHTTFVSQWIKANSLPVVSNANDTAVIFFQNFSEKNPGKFPVIVVHSEPNGKTEQKIDLVDKGIEIQSTFFELWRQDHPNLDLENVPGDLVTTSASGLDPHITLQNAEYQLDRVANQWAKNLKRDPIAIRNEIEKILQKNAQAPLAGLFGEKLINVLEVNLELNRRYAIGNTALLRK